MIGKSTLSQGITVPIEAETEWTHSIAKGEKIAVEICFDNNHQTVRAVLRRIDNAKRALQFRYENKTQQLFRDYLRYAMTELNCSVIEITQTRETLFQVRPASQQDNDAPNLAVRSRLLHLTSRSILDRIPEFDELDLAISRVRFRATSGQREYNAAISEQLLSLGWRGEVRVMPEIGLRSDFEKNGIWVEVEFGNARTYYQDYIKFLLACQYADAKCGVLLCPTQLFASFLCEVGRQRAVANHGRSVKYGGMMTYEKAEREFPFLEFIISSPVIVAGLEFHWPQPCESVC